MFGAFFGSSEGKRRKRLDWHAYVFVEISFYTLLCEMIKASLSNVKGIIINGRPSNIVIGEIEIPI